MRRTPFAGEALRVSAPEGSTIADFVATAFPIEDHRQFAYVELDGVAILPAAWQLRPSAGQTLTIVFRPGNSDFFRAVLQIALIAVATWVSGPAGFFAAGSWQAAVAAAGVMLVGNLAINALVPLKTPGLGAGDRPAPFYSITGARNVSPAWNVVPMLFGKSRIVPPLAGQVVQETVGDEVFLRIPLLLGTCPMAVSSWKIGETDLASFSGVEMETRLVDTAPAHTLYVGDPSSSTVNVAIGTGSTTRTTAAGVDEIEVVVGFASGLGAYDSKNRKVSRTVALNVEYRPTGSSDTWSSYRGNVQQANTAAVNAGVPYRPDVLSITTFALFQTQLAAVGGVPTGTVSFTRADPGRGFQRSIRFAVPRGQYDVRVSRTTTESVDPAIIDAVKWEYLNSVASQVDPFPNRKLATAVLRIKAGPTTNGVIETINCIAEQLAPKFDSSALADPTTATVADLTSPATTRNPAELGLVVARGSQTAIPKPDGEIDFKSWAAFAVWCNTNSFTFDDYVTTSIGRWEMLRRICRVGHARPVKFNGRLSVVIDKPRTGEQPSQTFNERNVRNFRWRKAFPQTVHAIRCAFANEANGWQADEVVVYLPGWDSSTATIFEKVEVPGITNADVLRTVLNQYARNAVYQTEGFEFEMDAEAVTVTRGAYVLVRHDVMVTGLGAAKIKTLETSGANTTGFILDAPIETTAGPTLGGRWRYVTNTSGVGGLAVSTERAVVRDGSNPNRFTFSTPIATSSGPVVGDMMMVGVTGAVALEALVQEIEPRANYEAAVRLVAYAGARFVTAPTWPAHAPLTNLPLGGRPASPVRISVVSNQNEMTLAFRQPLSPNGVTITGYETWVREKGTTDDQWEARAPLAPDARVFVAPVGNPGVHYDMKIEAIGFDSGGLAVRSDPLVELDVTAAEAPAAPAGCSASFATRTSPAGTQQLVLTANWTVNENPDVLDTIVELRVSTGPDVWVELSRARAGLGKVEIHGLQVGRDYVLGFTNLSRRGAPSTRTTISTITAADVLRAALSGLADGIVGQGALATLNSVLRAQLAAGVSANVIVDPYWRRLTDTTVWTSVNASGRVLTDSVITTLNVRQRLCQLDATAPSANSAYGYYQGADRKLPCNAGDKVEASCYVGGYGLQIIDVYIFWWNSSGLMSSSLVGRHGTPGAVPAMTKGGGGGDLSNYERVGGVFTAPANTVGATIAVYGYTPTASPPASSYFYSLLPMLAAANPAQTEMSPWNPGMDGQPGADVTSGNVASGIAGQGGQATANAQRGTSYSGTPTLGSWWIDTTGGLSILKFYDGSSWQTVANLKASVSSSISPTSVNQIHTGSSFSSGTITVTPSGATTYDIIWQFIKSGGAANVTLSAVTGTTCTVTASLSSGQDVTGSLLITVIGDNGASIQSRIPLNFSRTD